MDITKLPQKVRSLTPADKRLFDRFFEVHSSTGRLKTPSKMKGWIKKTFGSVNSVQKQNIINVLNKYTYEGALYNELRAKRPMSSAVDLDISEYMKNDVFSDPIANTPSDIFGRISTVDSISASNIAKYDTNHGLIIFDKFNPLQVTRREFGNHFQAGMYWFHEAHGVDKEAKYPFLLWNCLFKSGASLVHGHMQTLLAHKAYGRLLRKNEICASYKRKHKHNYYDDLYNIHRAMGLGMKFGDAKIFTSLTPAKEKETVIIGDDIEKDMVDAAFLVIEAFKSIGVESFNMFCILEPIEEKWNLPVVIRIVDRGSLHNKTTDVGALELFTQHAVIGSDPYKVFAQIKKMLNQ